MIRRFLFIFTIVGISLLSSSLKASISDEKINPIFVCNEDNDLYQLLQINGYACERYDDVEIALKHCKENGVLLILAANYPAKKTVLPDNLNEIAHKKNLKMYVEFPDRLKSEVHCRFYSAGNGVFHIGT